MASDAVILAAHAGRDVRVARAWRPRAALALACPRAHITASPVVERVLLRRLPPLVIQPVSFGRSLSFAPRLDFVLRVQAAPAPGRLIAERLVERTYRVASTRSSASSAVLAPVQVPVPSAPPVGRVLRRAAVSLPSEIPGISSVPTLAMLPARAEALRSPGAAIEEGASFASLGANAPRREVPFDLDRVTNEVVKAIDHRIMAYRERLGRA